VWGTNLFVKEKGLAKYAKPLILLWRPQGDLNPCCRRERLGFIQNESLLFTLIFIGRVGYSVGYQFLANEKGGRKVS